MALTANLNTLTTAQLIAALEFAGYTDNNIIAATYEQDVDTQTACYAFMYRDDEGRIDLGRVYVTRDDSGTIRANY